MFVLFSSFILQSCTFQETYSRIQSDREITRAKVYCRDHTFTDKICKKTEDSKKRDDCVHNARIRTSQKKGV